MVVRLDVAVKNTPIKKLKNENVIMIKGEVIIILYQINIQ